MSNLNFKPKFKFRSKPKSIFLALALLATAGPIFGQNKTVTINKNKILMKDALYQIEKQTNYLFVYDNSIINPNKAVSVDFKNEKLEDALAKLFKDTDVNFVIENRNILLLKVANNSNVNATQEKITVNGNIKDKNNQAYTVCYLSERLSFY